MLVAALILAALAAALHVYIWAMESLWWTTDRVRATFRTTPEDAQITKGLAFNQGFYNLFLAIVTAAGIVAYARDADAVGKALVIAGVGSMLAAAWVLVLSDRSRLRAAATQGTLPLLALLALVFA